MNNQRSYSDMPHFTTTKHDTHNMNDITSDFDCLKVSALRKASRISDTVRDVTIGPESIFYPDLEESTETDENRPDNYETIKHNIKESPKPRSKILSPEASSRSTLTFSIRKILLENEVLRRDQIRQAMQQHLLRMEDSARELQMQMLVVRDSMALEREQQEMLQEAELTRLEEEEEQFARQTEIRRKHEAQLHAQRILERKQRLALEAEELKKKHNERQKLIQKMIPLKATFQATYQNISAVLKSCKDRNIAGSTFASHAMKLEAFSQCMDGLVEQMKRNELTEADVQTAEMLVHRIQEILDALRHEIDQINAAYDAEIARREDQVRQAQVQEQPQGYGAGDARQQPNIDPVVTASQTSLNAGNTGNVGFESQPSEIQIPGQEPTAESGPPDSSAVSTGLGSKIDDLHEFVDKESLQIYLDSQQLLENHKATYQSLVRSDDTKKFRFDCQKAINIPVNAISGVSGAHLIDKYEKLHALLSGKPPITANQHPQGIAFCKHILAKKFVSQGETLVSSKPELAFSVAAVAVALWNEHPDFGELLMAYFHKTCPYLVPIFLPQLQGQSNQDYYKSLGYKYSDNGDVEEQDKFLKRMSGLMRLYAAVIVTKQRKHVTRPHPHGIRYAWRWLAALLNIEPRPDICATLILDMLEVTGNVLWVTYPTQFPKLLRLLTVHYYPRMKNVDGNRGGPMVRLEEFLRNSLTKGSIPPPEGRLPQHFW